MYLNLMLLILILISEVAYSQVTDRIIYPQGDVYCSDTVTTIVDVTNPTTGKTWMDRNLGASQVATSSMDEDSYGDLFQWGRRADGHQCRNSQITTTLSIIDKPTHGCFISSTSENYDWRSLHNHNLWQGEDGINNPCPKGYRLPTSAELDAERSSWISNDAAGAFASPLKLPMAGCRYSDGSINYIGNGGYYWSSKAFGNYANFLFIYNENAKIDHYYRAHGYSVRCIKN